MSLPGLEELPASVRRAVALAPPETTGINEHSHKVIREGFLKESGGEALLTAEEHMAAVGPVEKQLEISEVLMRDALCDVPRHPLAAAGERIALEAGLAPVSSRSRSKPEAFYRST